MNPETVSTRVGFGTLSLAAFSLKRTVPLLSLPRLSKVFQPTHLHSKVGSSTGEQNGGRYLSRIAVIWSTIRLIVIIVYPCERSPFSGKLIYQNAIGNFVQKRDSKCNPATQENVDLNKNLLQISCRIWKDVCHVVCTLTKMLKSFCLYAVNHQFSGNFK